MPPATRLHRAAALLFSLGITLPAVAGTPSSPADAAHREHDEIVVGGVYVHAGTPVVLWTDVGGFDLTGLTRPVRTLVATTSPTTSPTTEPAATRVIRGPGVPLDVLRESVDQFVVHFDDCGVSAECYRVLKKRGLSVQFMCDLDGTIYQTMDAGEAAPHATKANRRSVGCEIANMGTWPDPGPVPDEIRAWYSTAFEGIGPRIVIPAKLGGPDVERTKNFVGRPARPDPVPGVVQNLHERQYDYTPEQYRALAHLAATLCSTLPKIQPDFPRFRADLHLHDDFHTLPPAKGDKFMTIAPTPGSPTTRPDALASPDQPGPLIEHTLSNEQYLAFQGIVGHFHVQVEKDDPGPAFQWLSLLDEVRKLMTPAARAACAAARGQPVPIPVIAPRPG